MARMTEGEMVAGIRPIRTSERETLARSLATAMSQQLTRPTAPPKAAPCTRAMVGWGSS